jgi:hypothetical protein
MKMIEIIQHLIFISCAVRVAHCTIILISFSMYISKYISY